MTTCAVNPVQLSQVDDTGRTTDGWMGTLKPQRNRPLYSNTMIGTLAGDGWTVTFGTARRVTPSPLLDVPNITNSPPISGQCTNFKLFDAAL